MPERASRTSSSLNGLMMAVMSFMVSLLGAAGSRPPPGPARSEGLADRQHDRALAELFAEGVGHALVLVIGVDVVQAEVESAEGFRHAEAVVDVLVAGSRQALDLLVADVRRHGEAVGERELGAEVEITRALAVVRPEQVGERVRVLEAEELPAALDVGLERVRAVEAARVAAGVVVVEEAGVVAEVTHGAGIAAVEVPLDAAAHVGLPVREPADARGPGPCIEATGMGVVEAALERRLGIGLGKAAELVVADDRDVRGKGRVVGGGGRPRGSGDRPGDGGGKEGTFHRYLQ